MALAEQPLKKRKLFEPHKGLLPPLSQDEIMRKRRNRDELRSLYDCYRRIKYYLSQKDSRLMPDFEQAYLSLITASRGCTSAQRILGELIPRYASHCPTALEAAAKVAINMYNWNFTTILRGEDCDGVAFQTAKACIFGLVDICGIASSEAPTSSVIQGICSAVFLNVLIFFVSSFEGNDIFEIGNEFIVKVQDSKFFSELKEEVEEQDESMLSKLFKFRVLSLLRIFFCYPKNLLAACFETFKSNETDVGSYKCGNYLLRQVTKQIEATDIITPASGQSGDVGGSHVASVEIVTERVDASEGNPMSDSNQISADASQMTKNCLVGMVVNKEPPLRDWFFSKYKKLCNSVEPQILSEISSALEEVFGSFSEQIKEADTQEDSDEENSDPSKYISRQYLTPKISNQHEISVERSDGDQSSRINNASTGDALIDDRNPGDSFSGQNVTCHSIASLDSDIHLSNAKSNHESEGPHSIKYLETGDHGDSHHLTPSMKKALVSDTFPSPVSRPLELKNDAFERNQVSNANFSFPVTRSTMECVPNVFASPDKHPYGGSGLLASNRNVWYFDGDSAAMDVFPASKQLWLGSLGPDASEPLVKFQFEKFGPVDLFLFFPSKGFALVEYRNIMDAIKAREYMRGSSHWGAFLQVKFLDAGLGSRGSINGVAVGSCCHVYVGNVSSHRMKDEILHGLLRVGFRHPRMVSDLTSENALLMEFETAEDATSVMAHLRKLRKENGYHAPINKSLTPKVGKADVARSYMDGQRYFPAPTHQDQRNNSSGSMSNIMVGSSYVPPAFDSPIGHCKMGMSKLSSLVLSLSSKYNILHTSHSNDDRISRRYHATKSRDEDNVPTNTLWLGLPEPDRGTSFLIDDELRAVCSHAVGNAGSVIRVTRENMQTGSWFVELSSADAAITTMQNLRSCPGMFFQIEFSQPRSALFINKSERGHEFVSPRMEPENRGSIVQSGLPLQSNWRSSGSAELSEVGARNIGNFDRYDNNVALDLSQARSHSFSHGNDNWMYKKPKMEMQFQATGSMQCPPMASQGPTALPPQSMQASPFMRPVYYTPNSSWDTHSAHHQLSMSHMNPTIMPNNFHVVPPFLPASVTPLAQLPGATMQHPDPLVSMSSASFPPPSMPPPSPPPLPVSQPPTVPPPPSSPPPLQSTVGISNTGKAAQGSSYEWQGVLCKSGVHYCKINAHREHSDVCKYPIAVSEPTEWPSRLDMTKRTDFQHVKSTFSSVPPHKREVCRLLPSTSEDHKGFQDFITYLKQRECAGVIKIPAVKNMWARLLFILPYSHDTCSMLGIAPYPSECLIALVLPKETNFDS